MRKLVSLLALWVCVSVCATTQAPFTDIIGEYTTVSKEATFVLPKSLSEIGEYAFEGTIEETLIIPPLTKIIGDGAFSGNKVLKSVFIPKSVIFIGKNAFEDTPNITIHGFRNSYVASWATTHNIAFVYDPAICIWILKISKLMQGSAYLSLCLYGASPIKSFRQRKRIVEPERSMRPQDRPELYPINYRFP